MMIIPQCKINWAQNLRYHEVESKIPGQKPTFRLWCVGCGKYLEQDEIVIGLTD